MFWLRNKKIIFLVCTLSSSPDTIKIHVQKFNWIYFVLKKLSAFHNSCPFCLYLLNQSSRGVEIVKFSTCPGTSKWP